MPKRKEVNDDDKDGVREIVRKEDAEREKLDEGKIFDQAIPVPQRDLDVIDENKRLEVDATVNERLRANADKEKKPKVVCDVCLDTGAVAENIEKGKVTKWQDCPNCYRYEVRTKEGVLLKDRNGNPIEVRRLYSVNYNDDVKDETKEDER